MTTWEDVTRGAPELAAAVRAIFDSGTNKTLATLRRDGSPRISATELVLGERDVSLGMMGGSRKLADVRRDPRVALHSPTLEPPPGYTGWAGDAKLAGRLVETGEAEGHPGSAAFVLDITEVVLTHVEGERLVVQSWTPAAGLRRRERGEDPRDEAQ